LNLKALDAENLAGPWNQINETPQGYKARWALDETDLDSSPWPRISLFGYAVFSAEGPGPKQRLGPHLLAGLVTKGNPANRPTQNIQDTVSQIGRP